MDLKDKLVSSYPAFKAQVDGDRDIQRMRGEAIKNFDRKGFPTKRDEAWKYTSLRSVIKEDYQILPKKAKTVEMSEIEPYKIHGIDSYIIVFVDGIYCSHLSQVTHKKIDACLMSAALNSPKFKPVIDEYFNKIAPKDDSLSSLNTAFSREGAFIHVHPNTVADKPIQILNFSTGSEEALMLQPRNLVVVGENSQVQIIERHQSLTDNPVFTNSVTEIFVGKHAFVDYYKIQNDRPQVSLIDNTFISQLDESNFMCHTFSFGGKLTRNNLRVSQDGERAETTFKGITIIEDHQHVDHNTFVHHMKPNCESHQDYKGVFDEHASGVFDGYVLVDDIAQKIDAYQSNNNLLISDDAKINSKPQLEIYADDVKCSHGCTVGQMDKEALFYLKSRGIPSKEASALLMYAFTSEVLDSVRIPQLKDRIDEQIALKLGVEPGF